MMLRKTNTPLRTLLFSFAATACVGMAVSACGTCSGCGDDSVADIAENFPADTEMAVAAKSLEAVVEMPQQALSSEVVDDETRESATEYLDGIRDEFEGEFGIDPLDIDAWERWGFDTDGAVFVGFTGVGSHPVVCMPVDDRDNFEQFVIDVYAVDVLKLDDPTHRREDVDGHQIHTAGDELAWNYVDDSACVSSRDAIVEFVGGPAEASLNEQPGFQKLLDDGLDDSLATVYVTSDEELWSEWFGTPLSKEERERVFDHVLGLGMSFALREDVFTSRSWTGLDDEGREIAARATTPEATVDWSRFAFEDTTAVLRLSLNPEFIWQRLLDHVDDATMGGVESLQGELNDITGDNLDIEDDVIFELSGQMGLFVYDIGDADALRGAAPAAMARQLEALVVVQFIDPGRLEEVLEGLAESLDAEVPVDIEVRAVRDADGETVDDITVVDAGDLPAAVYQSDDLLVVATGALSEPEVATLLRGERSGDSLASADTALGGPVTDSHFNGLYLAGGAFAIGDDVADYIDEVRVSAEVTDTGVAVDAAVYPAGSALFGLPATGHDGYVDESRRLQMENWAIQVQQSQEWYFSRHHAYFDPAEVDGSSRSYDPDDLAWTQILEFAADVPPEVTIETDGGDADDPCELSYCDPDPSGQGSAWFAVYVEHEEMDFAIYHTSDFDRPRQVDPAGR